MAYVITNRCVGTCDTSCVDVCPINCIVGPVPAAELRGVAGGDRAARVAGIQMFIDPGRCIACGACVDECPVAAIYLDELVPAAHRDDVARNAGFFRRSPAPPGAAPAGPSIPPV